MAFCGICKRNHDPDIPCIDGTGQILRNMGLKKKDQPQSKEEFRRNERKARKFIFGFFFIVFVIAILLGLLYLNR